LLRGKRQMTAEIFELLPALEDRLNRHGGDLSGGQRRQLAISWALVIRPKLLVVDEPTEGIQTSVNKDIGRALEHPGNKGTSILLVEQYLDFCRAIGDHICTMNRGEVAHSCPAESLDNPDMRAHLTI